jgi:DNA integrity scanning protein DisA with diadenylate cyclase activity
MIFFSFYNILWLLIVIVFICCCSIFIIIKTKLKAIIIKLTQFEQIIQQRNNELRN